MGKFYIFLLLLALSVMTFAQAPVKQFTEREKLIFKINREVEGTTVIELLRKMDSDMRKSFKDKKPLLYLQYYSFASTMRSFVEYRWFIADTGLSKKWLKSVQEILVYMAKTRDIIQTSINNGHTQTAKYQQAVKYFDIAYERFAALIKEPVKVSSKVRRQAQVQKVIWQKNMRKKYNIEK